jgi:phosphotriesterase-related protein
MTTRAKGAKPAKKASPLSGKVQTVLGPIEPEKLGVTITHEHLLIDMTCYFEVPEEASERAWIEAPLTMDRLGSVMPRWTYSRDTHRLLDDRAAAEEAVRFKICGGGSVVDATSIGIARDPLALARISRATGLNVIMGASHYVPVSHPPDMTRRTEETIADNIIRDITFGVGDTGIRSGIIGEVGNFWPTSDNQVKVLRASAHAQRQTGAPILIHPGFHPDSPPHIIETLRKAGADLSRVIMGHLDVFNDRRWYRDLADTGCMLEWDGFGFEDTAIHDVGDQTAHMLSDVQRMGIIEYLIGAGFGDRILISHDVCTKNQYSRYGGKSFDHILSNIVPRMRKRGFTEQHINSILVENPKRILTFV